KVMPNPFSGQTTFSILTNGYEYQRAQIKVTNQLGALADVITIGKGITQYVYHNDKLQKGIYYYALELDSKKVKTGKLVIQ
ncbi:MAG: T9SS type A sorting domain-containing protein, partial [Chitinophagales bacterium]